MLDRRVNLYTTASSGELESPKRGLSGGLYEIAYPPPVLLVSYIGSFLEVPLQGE